jgi:hypothetical protein
MNGLQLNALCAVAQNDAEDRLPRRKYQLADHQAYYDAEYSRHEQRQADDRADEQLRLIEAAKAVAFVSQAHYRTGRTYGVCK